MQNPNNTTKINEIGLIDIIINFGNLKFFFVNINNFAFRKYFN